MPVTPGLPQNKPAIILVEPTGARNIGSIARVMANFGLDDLRLVTPRCNPLSMEAKKMAMRASHLLEKAKVYETCEKAVGDLQLVIATTARQRNANHIPEGPAAAARRCKMQNITSGWLFGTEESGLPNEALDLAQIWCTFPTVESYRSLNLAQSVGIACYEIHRSLASGGGSEIDHGLAATGMEKLLKSEDFAKLFAQIQGFLERINFVQEHTTLARMRRLSHILNRSGLSESDGRYLGFLFHFLRDRIKEKS